MEDKKQTEEGTVDFSSWKVLTLSTNTRIMLAC